MHEKEHLKHIAGMAVVIFVVVLSISGIAQAADVGNCLLCHKYPGLSRMDEDGNLKLLFVNESVFNNSVHANVKCEGCHSDIEKIPHENVKKVNCLAECHIIEPSSETKFSHADVEMFLSRSVHSRVDQEGNPKTYLDDYPDCKDCHDNPLDRPLSFFKRVRPGISETVLGRCRVCHKKDEFIFRYYNHITTRLHAIRSPKNIAQVCAKCHEDSALVARHELSRNAVSSYYETFHGKAASYLDERVPDCLNCHVNIGESVHQMHSYKDPVSITHKSNKIQSCSMLDCHPDASPKLAAYDVHPQLDKDESPSEYYFTAFFLILTGGTLLPLTVIMFLDMSRRLVYRKKESKE